MKFHFIFLLKLNRIVKPERHLSEAKRKKNDGTHPVGQKIKTAWICDPCGNSLTQNRFEKKSNELSIYLFSCITNRFYFCHKIKVKVIIKSAVCKKTSCTHCLLLLSENFPQYSTKAPLVKAIL